MKLKFSGGDIKAVQGDTGHAQSNMVTDVYSHIMDEDRKRLARKMDDEFFNTSDESNETQDTATGAAEQLMQMLKGSPELAEHLLQMTQLLRAKE